MVKAGFESDNHMLMYPAGICSRKQSDGTIRDIPWSKTFITKSVEYQRDVVPIHFSGQNSKFFYPSGKLLRQVSAFQSRHDFYMVDEMYKNVGKTFEVKIGKPIPPGRLLTRVRLRWNGRNLCKIKSTNYKKQPTTKWNSRSFSRLTKNCLKRN